MSESDTCGHPTEGGDGEPCQNPATGENGRCWIPAHNPDSDTGDGVASTHGRPSKLSQERADTITSSIAEGKSAESAARMAGIHPATVRNWLDRVNPEAVPPDPVYEDDPYAYFFRRFVRARGLGEDAYVADIMRIAREEGDLSTLLSMLKQRYPESWGDVDRGEQTGGVVVNVGDPDEHEIDPETLEVVDGAE